VSTQINVTVGSGGLSDKARQLQTAARQAQLEKERQQRLEAEGTEQRNAKLEAEGRAPDGSLLYGARFKQPEIDRRPAANRFGQGLNLGHLWKFGDIRRRVTSTGILSATGGGSSFTLTNDLRSSQYDLLLGCGNGNQWEVFTDIGTTGAPPLPADTYSGSITGERVLRPTFPPTAFNFNTGTREGGSAVDSDTRFFEVALPCGSGNFIYIYGFASIWSAFETSALYGVQAIYTAEPPDYGGSPDDWPFTGYQSPFSPGILLPEVPDRLEIFSSGSVSFTGYRGKQRRFAAYICNNSSIREISIPSGIQPLLDQALPEPVNATTVIQILNPANPEGLFVLDKYQLVNVTTPNFSNYSGLKIEVLDSYVYTPDVFRIINEYTPFTSAANIKSLPIKLKAGLADRSSGSWSSFQDTSTQPEYPWMSNFYREGAPFYYALWPNNNEEPNLGIWDPSYAPVWENFPKPKRIGKATLSLAADRVPRNGANDSNNVYGPEYYNSEDLITVWDWDDPNYCRSMCKALGFTDADLTP
jgi:hypothetical protein